MSEENTYTDAQGVRYVAKLARDANECVGCAHEMPDEYFESNWDDSACRRAAQCLGHGRADKRSIIWVRAK